MFNETHKKIPQPQSIGLMLTYKCSARCLHCMYACSPSWPEDWIESSRLDIILKNLRPYIRPAGFGGRNAVELNTGLHFTGGEPFLNYELLCEAVERAAAYSIPSLFVETNCFWCTKDNVTYERFSHLKSLGLHGVLISVNPFYLEYIPFERTRRAVTIGKEVFSHNLMVYQTAYFQAFSDFSVQERIPFQHYIEQFESNVVSNVEFFLNGRVPYTVPPYSPEKFIRYSVDQLCNTPCIPSFVRPWHNHIDNYGNYVPGYCGGITYGNAEHLDDLINTEIDREKTPVLWYLVEDDFRGLVDFAEEYGFVSDDGGYYSKCHLCSEIRRKLVETGNFKELQPVEFYHQLDT